MMNDTYYHAQYSHTPTAHDVDDDDIRNHADETMMTSLYASFGSSIYFHWRYTIVRDPLHHRCGRPLMLLELKDRLVRACQPYGE